MSNTYQIYLISDSTGETLDRIFLALKAQFKNIEYKVHSYSFTRTENQILKILEDAKKNENSVILYTIVDNNLAKYLANTSDEKKIPCFGVLGNLILNFSKILNQKASHEPSGQHVLNDEYYDRIEAIQFTMNHDDGNLLNDIEKSDIVLVGVSRTSKTPTSIYLANKGFKTSNIPLVNENSLPKKLRENPQITCVIGLNTEPERLVDLRKNRMSSLKETENTKYTSIENIKKEIIDAKKTFQKYRWPSIDVTRKSVEETATSIKMFYLMVITSQIIVSLINI
ncbi:kinase/pyrophosphorylase [Candidatus Pelagibacter sp.]|nr:kinase/pyrophosphorylase [Candidatus Pelagibacter sp.]